jgi:hypothetical protein
VSPLSEGTMLAQGVEVDEGSDDVRMEWIIVRERRAT